VSRNQGWGPHTRRDDVLYIGSGAPARQSRCLCHLRREGLEKGATPRPPPNDGG
jgi:hypothetical protein